MRSFDMEKRVVLNRHSYSLLDKFDLIFFDFIETNCSLVFIQKCLIDLLIIFKIRSLANRWFSNTIYIYRSGNYSEDEFIQILLRMGEGVIGTQGKEHVDKNLELDVNIQHEIIFWSKKNLII